MNLSKRLASEEEMSDQLNETENWEFHAVQACGEADEDVGDHCREDLETNRVLAPAEERLDVEVLLYPAEQQLDFPALFVESGNLDSSSSLIICDQCDHAAFVAPDPDPA
jgi:hypothetical protein